MSQAPQPLHTLTMAQLAEGLAEKTFTAVEVMQAYLARAAAHNTRIGAFISLDEAAALEAAKASDTRRKKKQPLSPLDGVPIAMKDVIAQAGQPLTCGSKILEGYTSPYSAHAVQQMEAAGLIPFGRANMDEFAMGSSTEYSAYIPTRNPWDRACVPGGSSGGSAAAVAASFAPAALGTDTGGSIRQPASFCGLVGLKTTYGLVSRYGLVAYASSFDGIGPLCRTVEDASLLLQHIAGHDARDSTSAEVPVPNYTQALNAPTDSEKPLRIGLPKQCFGEGLSPEVNEKVQAVVQFYKETCGAEIVEIDLPHSAYCVPAYYIMTTAEASANLARFDGVRYTHRSEAAQDIASVFSKSRAEGFGTEVKRRIMLGTYVLSSGYYDAYYLRAAKVRTLIAQDFENAFNTQQCDVLLTPTTPTPAFKIGEKQSNPVQMYLNDIYTVSANLAGVPSISVPCGFVQENKKELPVGFQLIGPAFGEAKLMRTANLYDAKYGFGRQVADIGS